MTSRQVLANRMYCSLLKDLNVFNSKWHKIISSVVFRKTDIIISSNDARTYASDYGIEIQDD